MPQEIMIFFIFRQKKGIKINSVAVHSTFSFKLIEQSKAHKYKKKRTNGLNKKHQCVLTYSRPEKEVLQFSKRKLLTASSKHLPSKFKQRI